MNLLAISLIALAAYPPIIQQPAIQGHLRVTTPVPLHRGMVITHSVRIKRGVYLLPANSSLDSAVIVVRGDDITIDFDNAELRGTNLSADPDMAHGVGVRIDGGSHVRIINARVRGYKIGLLARRTRDLSLIDNDFSYNWKPRLYSLVTHESLADWLSHHHDENEEWMRFGAGAFLSDVHGGEVRGNRIEQGMEGLMIERSDSLLIWNNTIQFNSGVGIGLYRSSYNRIMHNNASDNVRGVSPYYRRGQDSSDLLMYEQSCSNVVAYNRMTHGGDGLFLWAGQSTMDTGQGGANDNVFYANDFSYAVANAMEATFSRNIFVSNRAWNSNYGLWGGYSYDSRIERNTFQGDITGIAIEHGQNNAIIGNRFDALRTGINLWADPIVPSDWGYPKHRDTRSRNYIIDGNSFFSASPALRLSRTTQATITSNRFLQTPVVSQFIDSSSVTMRGNDTSRAHVEGDLALVDGLDMQLATPPLVEPMINGLARPDLDGIAQTPVDQYARATRDLRERLGIIIDEWGPYSWKYPRILPDSSAYAKLANPYLVELRVLGPKGKWSVAGSRHVDSVSAHHGNEMSGVLKVVPQKDYANDWSVTIRYDSEDTIVDARGRMTPPHKDYVVSYEKFNPITTWSVTYHEWNDSTDPVKHPGAFAALLGSVPKMTRIDTVLDYMWYAPSIKGLPQTKWAAVATTTVTLPAGDFTLRSISDDGVRVYVDGKRLIDDWAPHESAVDNARILPGKHQIRVEYYQVDGWTELRVEIVKGLQTSTGSPGPH